jgi:Transposase zinc-binding domain
VPRLEVADIFRAHGPVWRDAGRGHFSLGQLKVMSAIEQCRSAALGGHALRCSACEEPQIAYNSCRNRRETDRGDRQLGMAMVLHALGRKAEAAAALAWCIKEEAGTQAYRIADIYALRGQSAEAMRWLEQAFTQRDSALVIIKVDTALLPLNGQPWFKAVLRKMNLPE